MKIVIGADIVPTKTNIQYFCDGTINNIIEDDLENVLKNADFRIFNLETPLTDNEKPIEKCGPNLIAPSKCINGMKKLNVNLFTLANNHIMDQGPDGLFDTMKVLNENKIDYVGAGENIERARSPYIIEKEGIPIGVYACVEHEFSISTDKFPGANPFDCCDSFEHISELKKKCDYVIVLYHGGKEHYRFPSPMLQKMCRKICDSGADFVVCQHSHCVGSKEIYKKSTIVYGQGNFIFDARSNEYWDTSVLIELDLTDLKNAKINFIPLKKEDGKVKISHNDNILEEFDKRSQHIKNEEFVENQYSTFAEEMIQNYLCNICGNSLFFRVINKLCGHKLKKKISKKRKLALINYVECEAHRELVLKGLKNLK